MLVIRGRRVCANQFRGKKKKSANRATLVSFKHPQLLDWCYGFMGTNWSFVSCSRKTLYIHFLSLSLSYANIHHIYIFICSIFLLKWERWGTGKWGGVTIGNENLFHWRCANLVGSSKNYLYFQVVLILQVHIVNYKYNWLQWVWGRQRKK